jgi:hypothetical protein
MYIDRPPYQPNPFCFSAARQKSCVYEISIALRRAAEKQKGRYLLVHFYKQVKS